MSNRPKTKDAGWVGFSYAVSALLNSRLQRPSLAIADVTHMAVRTSDSRPQFPAVLNDLSLHPGELCGAGTRRGARGPYPRDGAMPRSQRDERVSLPRQHILRKSCHVSLSSGVHSSQDTSTTGRPRELAILRARPPLARAPRSRRCLSARPPTAPSLPSPGLATAACRPL